MLAAAVGCCTFYSKVVFDVINKLTVVIDTLGLGVDCMPKSRDFNLAVGNSLCVGL